MPGFKTFLNKLLNPPEKPANNLDWKQNLVYILVALLILIFTFPKYFPEIDTGPDGSEMFAFNYLFYHHIQFGTHVLFTYGPLGFIMSPTCIGNNLVTGMALTSIFRFLFIYSFLILGYTVNKSYRVLHIIMVIGLCNLSLLDIPFIGGTVLFLLLYQTRKEIAWLILGCLFTVLALLVKSSFGLMCTSILFSYAFYTIIFNRNIRTFLYILIITPFFFLFTWFLLYHNVSGITDYLWAMYQFSKDNSNAMQVDAINHWGILAIALACFYLPLFFTKNELTRILYLITIAALYAAFKYSFAREENFHQTFLFIIVIMICAMFLLLNSASRPLAVMLPLASIALLYANMVMTNTFNIDDRKRIIGIGNFITDFIDYDTKVRDTRILDSATLHDKLLDNTQRALIENSTVDCYPVELTYVAANTLNWAPRPNLQIGAYTPWLDNHNASFLASKEAPRFYIWELEQPPLNNYSIDNHFTLNDEPQTIYEFYNHYELLNHNAKTAIFGRSDTARLGAEHITGTGWGLLNTWIYAPITDTANIVRAQIHFTNTLAGCFKKAFYKDQIYTIDYLLSNSSVKTYRFVPANAVSGLWVNPLVTDVTKELSGEKVLAIRIRVDCPGYLENLFKLDWTRIHVK